MYTHEICNLINQQNGTLTCEQYINIYDYSPQLKAVFYNEGDEYEFEFVFNDKEESVLFNIITD